MPRPSGQWIRHNTSGEDRFAAFDVGDVIKITGSNANNGIYTINSITNNDDSGTDYSYMGLTGPSITDDPADTGVVISDISSKGNRVVCLGDEDTGEVDVWSYSDATDEDGSFAVSPVVGTNGWSTTAIKPVLSGSNANFIFTQVDDTIRVCDTNQANASSIKWYGYLSHRAFGPKGGTFGGYEEHPNILQKPSRGGKVTTGTTDEQSYGVEDSDGTALTDKFDIRRWLKIAIDTSATDKAANFTDNKIQPASQNLFTDATQAGAISSGTTITMDGANANIVVGLAVTGGTIPSNTIVTTVADSAANPQVFVISNAITSSLSGGTTLTFGDGNSVVTNIPNGIVIGMGQDDDNDRVTSIGAERFLIRHIDTVGADSYNMTVYRGYAGTLPAAVDVSANSFIYQYGCGFNFLPAENGTSDSGTYMANVYEFAQSFIYENDQESLLRTDTDIGAANTLTTSNNSRALDVTVYAHGPYPGRIKGGRIYQRISGTNQPWSLLVDINFERGCRTALAAQYITCSDASGEAHVPNGCFYCAGLKSIHPQIDTYSSLNGFEPEIDFTSIGGIGERYQTAVIAGRRMFIANLQLKNTTGGVERFGDRIMYSEPNKFDTFPEYNFIDVSKGDAEDYVKLEFFADRLLAFKQHTLHVINIQNSSPAGWYLEKSVKHVGVSYPYSVVRTPLGVAWANQTGCHFFDGRNVSDLTQGKIKEVGSTVGDSPSWDSFVTGSSTGYTVKPVVMYVPKKKQLVILRNPDHGSTDTNQCYIYDFKTNSWVYDTSLFTEAQEITNSIVDWNNNLVYAYGVDASNVKFKQISDTSTGTSFTQGSCSYNNDPTITHGANANIVAGLYVTGTGIPTGATISSITDTTHFELSASTTGDSLSSQTLTFYSGVIQSFITKDIDFGQPAYVKKIYKIYITYKNITPVDLADDMHAAVDGSTTFANSSISSPHSSYDVAITGTFAASQSNWNIATFSFSKPLLCQSLALKFLGGSTSGISINDISFEYRILRKRVS